MSYFLTTNGHVKRNDQTAQKLHLQSAHIPNLFWQQLKDQLGHGQFA